MAPAMVLQRHHIEELAELPEDRALETHLDELCWGRLAVWMRFALVAFLGWALGGADETRGWSILLPILSGVLLLVYFLWRRRGLEQKPFLRYGYVFLLAQVLLVRLAVLGDFAEGELGPFDFLLPGLLLIFPLPVLHRLGLYSVFWLPLMLAGRPAGLPEEDSGYGNLIALAVYLALCLGGGWVLYRRRVKSFVASWQRAREWALESLRMREELDQARRIQLSMLPQHDPYSPWLDIAGSSRPATEVGGDYYGFFDLGEGRQALVVADVAGHGVASGLLLAGVRGCLVMLHEDAADAEEPPMAAPRSLLARLNRVVRTVGGRRNFVTMVYCLFEPSPPRLTVAAAGHPPLLRWRRGTIEEVPLPSLPLGTTLAKTFPEETLEIEAGDVYVFATDGIAETMNTEGILFGDDRLHATLGRAAAGTTAAEIRDALLAELEAFLGEGDVQDDVTLVVVRVKN
jgi:serine phosphatase RsbU (regulator of sigma subunit)